MLEQFQDLCAFRVYMKLKPAKYSLKIFALVNAKYFYALKLEIYVGQ